MSGWLGCWVAVPCWPEYRCGVSSHGQRRPGAWAVVSAPTARQDTAHLQTLAAGVPTLTLVNVKEFYCRTNSDFLRKIWKYLPGRYLLVVECVNVNRYLQRTVFVKIGLETDDSHENRNLFHHFVLKN